ncbi:MAG: hypothetical protein EZS28_011116 [Streblomastix strix]|uniref:Uncharacterized protein n=1 Tax=Streblomastix strix TaxID=222440 RepID=A0A5J4WF35_9EUKA|nr:MAG: hypothetical protein EZS28_011116 [Streblomastix strix]
MKELMYKIKIKKKIQFEKMEFIKKEKKKVLLSDTYTGIVLVLGNWGLDQNADNQEGRSCYQCDDYKEEGELKLNEFQFDNELQIQFCIDLIGDCIEPNANNDEVDVDTNGGAFAESDDYCYILDCISFLFRSLMFDSFMFMFIF